MCDHFHEIGWYLDVALANNLILAGAPNADHSIILATIETGTPPPQTAYYVQLHSVAAGSCVFRIARMGTPDPFGCPPPEDTVYVHYQIINPLP